MKIKKITKQNQAEQRADLAERTMAKLQKEVDRLEGNYFLKKMNVLKYGPLFIFIYLTQIILLFKFLFKFLFNVNVMLSDFNLFQFFA